MRARTGQGYTLIELVVVVAILAVIAAVAVPNMRLGSDTKLRLAAEQVADAIRFARSEAIRTGEGHGFTVSQVTQEVTVEKYDISSSPIIALGTLTHPVDKQPYDFNVNTSNATAGVSIGNSVDAFDYGPQGRRKSVIFDANGTPVWVEGSDPTRHLLQDGTIELSYGGGQLDVSVTPITGRVTVQ